MRSSSFLASLSRPLPWEVPLFVSALVLQTLLLLAAPLQQSWIYSTGRDATLLTAPVDPYNVLSGYYVTLSYAVSRPASPLPGAPAKLMSGDVYYVVLVRPKRPGDAWRPLALKREQPTDLPVDQIALRGRVRDNRLVFGLETYYIPEERRMEIDASLRGRREPALVDIKVGADGRAVPLRLRVAGKVYEF